MCLQSRIVKKRAYASVAELVDALDLGSSGATRESSSLSTRTIYLVVEGHLLLSTPWL